jgi:diguanylate cyclase (GGDEF)-like protein
MAVVSLRRLVALVLVAVLLIGGTVFSAAVLARNSAEHAAAQTNTSDLMLTAMLNQETGARGYFETRARTFLQPFAEGSAAFPAALSRSRSLAGTDHVLQVMLTEQAQVSASWHAATQAQLTRLQSAGVAPTVRQALDGKAIMDRFRGANGNFDAQLSRRREAALATQTWVAVALAAVLSLGLALSAIAIMRRAARNERKRVSRQSELRDLLQVSESETESRGLLIRHIGRIVPGAAAAVFHVNNSDNRLEAEIADGGQDGALRGIAVNDLRPRSCLAVRLSRAYERLPGQAPLLQCEVCGTVAGDLTCLPLLVGGLVIGSVLTARPAPIGELDRGRVRESVVQAAPILANQRNLALAELRAASDALTGLPNRRAADETLKRLAAHAGRQVSPLSVVMLDLDHFKQINDIHGHDQGDRALAAVGETLRSTLRASDFAARYGGEEFIVLLPDTDRDAARDVAEKLRLAIQETEVTHVGPLSASFGVAVMPADATEIEQLIRKADRALYSAKADGRNRVKTAPAFGAPASDAAEAKAAR